jgi:uncharacterized protein
MYHRIIKISPTDTTSILLLGPRGTGKTLWARNTFPQALYLDLLDFNLYKDLLSNPSRLANLIPTDFTDFIIIDEVQKIPELLNEVHRLIETRKLKFLLTGSSARSLKRKGVNLLAGRALHYNMHPFLPQELGKDFDLAKALVYGLLPLSVISDKPSEYLATYVEIYLREEVLQEALTRNIGAFARFLEIASFSQGSIVNYSEIAREICVDRQVVRNYFNILEDLLLATSIPPFTKRAKRRLIMNSKFYFFDVGIYRSLRPRGPIDVDAEIDGHALETLFLQCLRAINDYYDLKYKIYFWRSTTGLEVDFVVYGEGGFYAFAIKRTQTVTPKQLHGLQAFATDYPEAKLYFCYMGKMREYHGNITAIPFEAVLLTLPDILKK